jgi:hypothetical protein
MKVNQGHTDPVPYVGHNHVLDQGGLAGPGLADDIDMGTAVLLLDAEQPADVAVIGHGEVGDPVEIVVCF